jgi:hypothetical protein
MTIEDLEETYRRLRERLLRGELDEDSFKTQVEQLRFKDNQGDQWKIGSYTGQWYRYDQGKWIQAKPSKRQQTSTEADDRSPQKASGARRAFAPWLAFALIGLLALAAIALVIGWYAGWWGGTPGLEIAASATQAPVADTATPTVTLPVSPTTAILTTPSPSPVATVQPTRTPSPTPTPSATAVPLATPSTEPPISSSATPSPPPPSTAAPALSGQILFPVYDSTRQTFDIYSVDLATGERELVVEQASQPAVSPNGNRLVYRSWSNDQRGLRVQELADGHAWTWISFGEAAHPSWSPDSQNIVFASQQEPDRQWRIYRTFGLEFDRVRRHGGDILGRVPSWLANGRIVYWECPLSKCGLYAMLSDGTSPSRLTAYEYDTAPSGSPDASHIAFMSNRVGNWEIYVASTSPAAEPEATRLTQNPARDGLPAWSPDGKWLAFVTDRDGPWAVWAMQPDGAGQRKLFGLGGPLEGDIARVTAGDQNGWTWESIAWTP